MARLVSVLERRQRPQHFSSVRPVENRVVLTDFSVAEDQHTLGELCDVEFVRNQDDRQPLVIQVLEDLLPLLCGMTYAGCHRP